MSVHINKQEMVKHIKNRKKILYNKRSILLDSIHGSWYYSDN